MGPSLDQSRGLVNHDKLTVNPSLHPIKEHVETGHVLLVVSQTSIEGWDLFALALIDLDLGSIASQDRPSADDLSADDHFPEEMLHT